MRYLLVIDFFLNLSLNFNTETQLGKEEKRVDVLIDVLFWLADGKKFVFFFFLLFLIGSLVTGDSKGAEPFFKFFVILGLVTFCFWGISKLIVSHYEEETIEVVDTQKIKTEIIQVEKMVRFSEYYRYSYCSSNNKIEEETIEGNTTKLFLLEEGEKNEYLLEKKITKQKIIINTLNNSKKKGEKFTESEYELYVSPKTYAKIK